MDVPDSTALRDELLRLETALARGDPAGIDGELDDLLALIPDDFSEHGASGRRWDSAEVRVALASEPPRDVRIHDFEVRVLAAHVALATYRSTDPRPTRRVSVWVRREGRWVMAFHQGTLVP